MIRPEKQMPFSSVDWTVLRSWLKEQEEALKDRLVSTDMSPEQANVLRGRIQQIKEILRFEIMAASARLQAAD